MIWMVEIDIDLPEHAYVELDEAIYDWEQEQV